MLHLLSKYLPRKTLIELYKLYIRPYLDYGDIIYHLPCKICDYHQHVTLNTRMDRLKSPQYSAALAVTGEWRGKSQEKLYDELGWDRSISIDGVGFLFCYTRILLTQIPKLSYSFRKNNVARQICKRAASYEARFYLHPLSEWNKRDPEIRLSRSVSWFRN